MGMKFKHGFYFKVWLIWICKAKATHLDKHEYSSFSFRFDSRSEFLFTDGSSEKISLFFELI